MNLAEYTVNCLDVAKSSSARFKLNAHLVIPLHMIGHKCRDPLLRRRGLSLLSNPRREGVWDSTLARTFATWAMEIEEKYLEDREYLLGRGFMESCFPETSSNGSTTSLASSVSAHCQKKLLCCAKPFLHESNIIVELLASPLRKLPHMKRRPTDQRIISIGHSDSLGTRQADIDKFSLVALSHRMRRRATSSMP